MPRIVPALIVLLMQAWPAHAVDGVIEINQAKALAGDVTPGDTADFPVTISAPGSYVLTGNLTVGTGKDGIEVLADGVTIDLNGFEIAGPVVCTGSGSSLSCGAGVGYGIDAQLRFGTIVHGGRVRGFGDGGVLLLGGRADIRDLIIEANGSFGIIVGPGSLVSEVSAYRNGSGGIAHDGTAVVEKSITSWNGGSGITKVSTSTGGSSIVACVANHNATVGIIADAGDTIRNSVASFNVTQGIFGTGGPVVSNNTVLGNGARGIDVSGGGVVEGNTARQNGGTGIYLHNGGVVRGNFVSQNAGNGIESPGGGATVVYNTANGNSGWGFVGAAGVTDALGGNNFVGNGSGGALNAIAIHCNTTNGIASCPP